MNKLMDRPGEEVLRFKVKKLFYGNELEDYITNSIYNDWCRFVFRCKGVKEKIEKEKLYKVWFEYHDAADPMDSSCTYTIYYIEEVPDEIKTALETWKSNQQKVKDYLFEE